MLFYEKNMRVFKGEKKQLKTLVLKSKGKYIKKLIEIFYRF